MGIDHTIEITELCTGGAGTMVASQYMFFDPQPLSTQEGSISYIRLSHQAHLNPRGF